MVTVAASSTAQPVFLVNFDTGIPYSFAIKDGQLTIEGAGAERDTNGDPVPTYKAHTYTYDTSGNEVTDTVADGTNSWVKTTTYINGQRASDSGWVKQ